MPLPINSSSPNWRHVFVSAECADRRHENGERAEGKAGRVIVFRKNYFRDDDDEADAEEPYRCCCGGMRAGFGERGRSG